MAGHRRTTGLTAEDGSPRPMSSAGRTDRINTRMQARYAEARTELDRFSVMADYVRSAAKVSGRTDPDRTDAALNGLVRRMLAVADELLERGKR